MGTCPKKMGTCPQKVLSIFHEGNKTENSVFSRVPIFFRCAHFFSMYPSFSSTYLSPPRCTHLLFFMYLFFSMYHIFWAKKMSSWPKKMETQQKRGSDMSPLAKSAEKFQVFCKICAIPHPYNPRVFNTTAMVGVYVYVYT